jgi:hypothetical protein
VATPAAKPPVVVAELGRPETLEETADRKAEASRNYRARKTINNLWFSIIVTVGLVLLIVIFVPRNDTPLTQSIDYVAVTTDAQGDYPVPLAIPELSKKWSSNAAEDRTSNLDDVAAWYVGLITPSNQFLGLTQGVDANPSWVVEQVDRSRASGEVTIDGVDWTVYDNSDASGDTGNVKYALSTESGRSTFVIAGTASPEEAATLASSISKTVLDQPAKQGATAQ